MDADLNYPTDLGGTLVRCDSEAEWYAIRMTGVTGSDASKIAYANKYGSAYELWCEKTGLLTSELAVEDPKAEQSEAAQWGLILEPTIRDFFRKRSGYRVVCDPQYAVRRHPKYAWMLGSLDGHVLVPQRGWGVWECKTAGAYMRDKWDEAIPPAYLVQVMHYLAVTGYGFAIVSALIGGQAYREYIIERDDDFVSALIQAERAFLNCVQGLTPPAIDGHPATTKTIATIYPSDGGEMVDLPETAITWDDQRNAAIAEASDAVARRAQAENLIKQSIGNASYGYLPNGVRYSWKGSPRRLQRSKEQGNGHG